MKSFALFRVVKKKLLLEMIYIFCLKEKRFTASSEEPVLRAGHGMLLWLGCRGSW
jgi:hypothetical protein